MKYHALYIALALASASSAQAVTLRIADQKGNMRAEMTAAHQLDKLSYAIEWAEFPAAAPWRKRLMRARWTRALSATRRCSFRWPPARR